MKWKQPKNNSKNQWWNIKTTEKTVMKKPKTGEMNKYNQRWKYPETIVKISGEMKTPEVTVIKNPKGFSWKSSSFLSSRNIKKNSGFPFSEI